eukprot:1156953-Pelagomonas_calceolata.AAC.2
MPLYATPALPGCTPPNASGYIWLSLMHFTDPALPGCMPLRHPAFLLLQRPDPRVLDPTLC